MSDKKSRDPYLDNARFILVVLVVIGHLISPMRNEYDSIYWLNNFLASFRMPALIVITGFFAKRFYQNGYIEKITIKLFVPYLIFQVFYAGFNYVIFDYGSFSINWFTPYMGMWFLLSLYCWNLLLFIFSRLKHPIIISLIMGIVIGCVADVGSEFSIMRTLIFFPFFLIGFHIGKQHFEWLKKPVFKGISICAIFLSAFLLHYFSFIDAREMVLGKYSYESLGLSDFQGMIRRSVFYVIMGLGVFSFMPWVPKSRIFFTTYGRQTAYIYLLHFIIIKSLYGINWFNDLNILTIVSVPLFALGLAVLLSSKPVRYITKPFVEGFIVTRLKDSIYFLQKIRLKHGRRLKSGKV